MTILLVGGGSGGHITPVLAVAKALKHKHPDINLVYTIGKNDALYDLPVGDPSISRVVEVRAGKFRRYHGEGLAQLFDLPTLLKNIRDFFYTIVGFFQSVRLIKQIEPDGIFIKGGFVGVPVGLAAALLKVPYVTHDSDAIPGLANRIIARWARKHAVALDASLYPYPQQKTVSVGVPVASYYLPVSDSKRRELRKSLDIAPSAPVLCVTGGGNGSVRINNSITHIATQLFEALPDLHILHIAGRDKTTEVEAAYDRLTNQQKKQIIVKDFVTDLARYSGASDVIVSRAGANTLADFAVQKRACIVVPNPALAGGHQLKNAQALVDARAIVVVDEVELIKGSDVLPNAVISLLKDAKQRELLGENLHKQIKGNAAELLADLLITEFVRRS